MSRNTLPELPDGIARPLYDLDAVRIGVVHLGIGAFHRAHQATLFDAALAGGDLRWGVCGVSLRSTDVRDAMVPQDGLYSVVERDGPVERVRVLGSVRRVLVAPEDPEAVVAAIASPDVHLVTLTITEKGYHLSEGGLDLSASDVAHDLAFPERPRTAVGLVVAALARRRTGGSAPITVASCDNLPDNGRLLRDAVVAFAARLDEGLAQWISATTSFPSSMVDRIVPATTEADILRNASRLHFEDRSMVKTEPFWQWVVEDKFSGQRPDLAILGVQLTDDIAPWEATKLRLLNGAHSAMAYLGGLAGIEHVHEFVAMPAGCRFVERLWDESASTMLPPPGLDIEGYREALMARFANPALMHRIRQIAADGSQKMPQRLLAPIACRIERGQGFDALALAVAAWMRWQSGIDDQGMRFEVDDPLAEDIGRGLAHVGTTAGRVEALLSNGRIFPSTLARHPRFVAGMVDTLSRLEKLGSVAAIERLVGVRHEL